MAARTRVGFGGPAAAYRPFPFAPRVAANSPAMLFLGDARLRGAAVTTPNYEATVTLAAATVTDVRLIIPRATDISITRE